jgi:type IV secretory pathway VirB6-like protein
LSNPALQFDGATAVEDWSSFSTLYDSYRVESLKLTWFPRFPNSYETATGGSITFTPIFLALDVDAATNASLDTVAEIIQYEKLIKRVLFKEWSVSFKCPRITSSGVSSSPVLSDGFLDIATPPSVGVIGIVAVDLAVSTTYGKLLSEYKITFKHRR